MLHEFVKFPSIPRLRRDITITEKIDGTNGAIVIQEHPDNERGVAVVAQSRKQVIRPDQDNFGFAKWVSDHADDLVNILGPGVHFGEWWGSGIQRGYGLKDGERRFSLFNTKRWHFLATPILAVPELTVVPALYEGLFSEAEISYQASRLRDYGSHAAPGFTRPEGVVIYHHAANMCFKYTLEGDGHKGAKS